MKIITARNNRKSGTFKQTRPAERASHSAAQTLTPAS